MANYDAYARSNYFAVKDPDAFIEWAASRHLTVWDRPNENEETKGSYPTLYTLGVNDGGWPSTVYDTEADDDLDVDIGAELKPHIADGWAAILMEVGHEKLRYVGAYAIVVTPEHVKTIDLCMEALALAEDSARHVYGGMD